MKILLSILIICVLGVAAAVWAARAYEKQLRVTVRDGILCIGKEQLPISEIRRVDIAPLYDLAPADDLWIFEGTSARKISFFNRDPGATSALRSLEAALAGLHAEQALFKAREESVFEQPVNVWRFV